MEDNKVEVNKILTIRNVIKLTAIALFVFTFCPTFTVSCAGQSEGISIAKMIPGLKIQGYDVIDKSTWMIIFMLLPLAIAIIMFSKMGQNKAASYVLILSAIDFVAWISVYEVGKKYAEEQMVRFDGTGWLTLNYILLLIQIIISVLIILKKIGFDDAFISSNTINKFGSNNQGKKRIIEEDNYYRLSAEVKYCGKCGTQNEVEANFCAKCGSRLG